MPQVNEVSWMLQSSILFFLLFSSLSMLSYMNFFNSFNSKNSSLMIFSFYYLI